MIAPAADSPLGSMVMLGDAGGSCVRRAYASCGGVRLAKVPDWAMRRDYFLTVVRRNQQAKRELNKASKAAAERLDLPDGTYQPPAREDCQVRQWETPVDDLATVRLQFNIWRYGGRLVEFVVNVQRLSSNGWVDVERFDCCHGHCHLHIDNAEGEILTIRTLNSVDDVKAAFLGAQNLADERARSIRDEGA